MLTIEMETEQTTGGTTTYCGQQTPNTFRRGLLKRLRIANELANKISSNMSSSGTMSNSSNMGNGGNRGNTGNNLWC